MSSTVPRSELEVLEGLRSSPVFGALTESTLRKLSDRLEQRTLAAGAVLFSQGESADALYVVLTGELAAFVRRPGGAELALSTMVPGGVVGEIPLVFGGLRTATVRAKADTVLGRLSRADLEALGASHPELLEGFAGAIRERLRRDKLVELLPKLFGSVDREVLAELDDTVRWVRVPRGERLFAQGDSAEGVYFNVIGRLRAVIESDGEEPRTLREIPRGELIGEMALFTGARRSASVYAVRNSELACIDARRFDQLMARHPGLHRSVTGTVVRRLQDNDAGAGETARIVNVAVVPLGDDVPSGDFARRLVAALAETESAVHVDKDYVERHLGTGAMNLAAGSPHDLCVRTWLDQLEAEYRFVVYEADAGEPSTQVPGSETVPWSTSGGGGAPAQQRVSPWTLRCVRQADLVILVGRSGGSPEPTTVERSLLEMESDVTAARRWLVILHPDGSQLPSGTRRWLGGRRLELHHHVRWGREADFARLARFLRGRAIGLVLGGGGARGVAHFGVIRALVDSEIPIDFIGGTSLGGLIAPRYAMGKSIDEIERDGRDAFVSRRPLRQLTLPVVSLIRPNRMTRIARDIYGDVRFEDLWLNCFCVACDISTGETVVLREGLVWKAVLASSALPGISVPVVHGGRLLVDGGVVDNLPGGIMKKLCGGDVILVDVSPEGDLTVDYTEIPSASRILWSWLLPHRKSTRIPTIGEVLARATTVSSVRRRPEARRLATLVLSPPLERFGLLEFEAFDEIVEAGYRYAMDAIARWSGRDGGSPSRG